MGVLGILAQGVVLKYFNDWLGERKVIIFAFTMGTITNLCYGLAETKQLIYLGIAISAFSGMAFPAISALKSNNVVRVLFWIRLCCVGVVHCLTIIL